MITRKRAWRLLAALAVGWLPVLVGHAALQHAAALFPLADAAHPYVVPAHAGLLYLWAPLVSGSAMLLLLSPGLLLALAVDSAESVGHWIVSALALSLLDVSLTAALVQALIGKPLEGLAFAGVVVACAFGSFGALRWRCAHHRPPGWPLAQPHAAVTLASIVIVPLLLLIALTPKFYWENFNGDGAHAFESARLLLVQSLPLWPAAVGDIAAFPGITSVLFAFPTSCFIRLFGDLEVSARLPFLLHLIGLYGVLLALIEHERKTAVLGLPERLLMWVQLATYTVALAFSATYSPYSADLALPATQDTLAAVCFLGSVLAFIQRRHGWTVLFVILTFLSLPNGLLLIGLWCLSVLLVWRPRPWRAEVVVAAAALGCVLAAALLPALLAVLHLPVPGNEYAFVNLVKRFAFLQWADWRRVLYAVIPGGILPAAALFAWRTHDRLGRALTLVTAGYFGFFYLPAHTALHYFIPAMVIPLVVFWRARLVSEEARPLLLLATGAAAVLALWISLPIHGRPHTTARLIGDTVEDRLGGYEQSDPAAFRRATLLRRLFPLPWDPRVPAMSYGGSELVWSYYAHRSASPRRDVNYVLQPATAAPPAGMHFVAQDDAAALYVRSDEVWRQHLTLQPLTPAGSSAFTIPRDVLFGFGRPASLRAVTDVRQVMQRWGINIDALLKRWGVLH